MIIVTKVATKKEKKCTGFSAHTRLEEKRPLDFEVATRQWKIRRAHVHAVVAAAAAAQAKGREAGNVKSAGSSQQGRPSSGVPACIKGTAPVDAAAAAVVGDMQRQDQA